MKYPSILILSLIIVSACNRKIEDRLVKKMHSNGNIKLEYVYPDKKNKNEYFIQEYYENGKLMFKGWVENEKFTQQKICYHDNGKLKSVDSLLEPCEIASCDCNAKVRTYNFNGTLSQSYENKKGQANTTVTFYTDSSEKIDVIYTFVNEKKNDPYTSFYNNGKIYSVGSYKDDTLVNYQYFFKENGDSLKYNYTYKGKLDFPYKKWLDDGQTLVGVYKRKYDIVTYVWYDKGGKQIKTKTEKKSNGDWIIPE